MNKKTNTERYEALQKQLLKACFNKYTPATNKRRCPNCGSPVIIKGNRFECGWCGNFGKVSCLI